MCCSLVQRDVSFRMLLPSIQQVTLSVVQGREILQSTVDLVQNNLGLEVIAISDLKIRLASDILCIVSLLKSEKCMCR